MDVVPQLDFSLYPSQVFWFFVAFLLLYVVVRGAVLPRVREISSGREALLDESVGTAYRDYEKITKELLRQQAVLTAAEQKARALLEKARTELGEAQGYMFAMLDAELKEMLRETEDALVQMAERERDGLIRFATEVARAYCMAVIEGREVEEKRLRGLVSKVYGGKYGG